EFDVVGVIFVSPDGSDDGGDGTAKNPFQTIQAAVDSVSDDGAGTCVIYAAAGLYEEQVIINKSLSIIGAPGATVRAPAAASMRAVRFAESTNAGGTPYTWNPIVLAYGGSMDDEGNISGSGTIDVYIEGLT